MGILIADQLHALLTAPRLNLFFPRDSQANIAKNLVIHELRDVVFLGEPGNQLRLVLEHAPFQIVGHPRIKNPRGATKNVNVVEALAHVA